MFLRDEGVGRNLDLWYASNPDNEVAPVSECHWCEAELRQGDDCVEDNDGEIYCDTDCLMEAYLDSGIVKKTVVGGE